MTRRATAAALCAAVVLGLSGATPFPVRAATTFTVTRTGDGSDTNLADNRCDVLPDPGDQCTLRAAIQQANFTAGADVIRFNITTPSRIIAPLAPLPAITGQVTLNGYSQPGTSVNTQAVGNNAVLGIVLDGVNAGAGANGLTFDASNSIVRGLIIQRFDGAGILINGDNNQVIGDFIGTNFDGTTARGNNVGIRITGANNIVGGTDPAPRNVISGNTVGDGYGIFVDGAAATGNRIQGNYIGTNKAGTAALGNVFGVRVQGATDTLIGGFLAGARNVISGNSSIGVSLELGSDDSSIQGNLIGTDSGGTVAVGNGIGVTTRANDISIGGVARNVISGNSLFGLQVVLGSRVGVVDNFIGTDVTGTVALGNANMGVRITGDSHNLLGNVISANGGGGVFCTDSTELLIRGNSIGTDAEGAADLGNGLTGIHLSTSCSATVGGTTAAARNIISGNAQDGISALGANLIQGNYIGTDVTGTIALGNGFNGVRLGTGNTLGGTVAGARNVISGNAFAGVLVFGSMVGGSVVQGNRIGTKADGTGDLGNGTDGIEIQGSSNTIGGTTGAAANLISGNSRNGIFLHNPLGNDNQVRGNVIRRNDARGIRVDSGTSTTITGNKIFENALDGVEVRSGASGVQILGNEIHVNGQLGIDLSGGTQNSAGVTSNDPDDPDTGANNLQNFPVLTFATRSNTNGITSVVGSLNSTPSTSFRIDLYLAAVDPSGHGEGQFMIATQNVTTNAQGDIGFAFQSGTLAPGHVLTATATRASGDTSEFSANRTVVPGP